MATVSLPILGSLVLLLLLLQTFFCTTSAAPGSDARIAAALDAQFSPKLFLRNAVQAVCGSPSPSPSLASSLSDHLSDSVFVSPLVGLQDFSDAPLSQTLAVSQSLSYEQCQRAVAARYFSVKQGEFYGLVPLLDEEIDRRLADFGARKFNPLQNHLEGNVMGYPEKYPILQAYANDERVETICEIGFNSGYSTLFMALQNPKAKFYEFDIFYHNYSALALSTLQEFMPDRDFVGIAGDASTSVSRFHRMFPDVRCNLIFIDGGHLTEDLHLDLENMALLANQTYHRVLVDDTPYGNNLYDEYNRFVAVNITEDSKRSMFHELEVSTRPSIEESYNHSHVKLRHIQQYFMEAGDNPCFHWELYSFVDPLQNYVAVTSGTCNVGAYAETYKSPSGLSIGEYLF